MTQRLKGSGMTWSMPGGEAILSLRALALPDRFGRAWDMVQGTGNPQIENVSQLGAI